MIAGLKNSDTISDDLKYAKHVRYGLADEDYLMNKSEQLEFLAKELSPIPYKIFKADELTVESLNELYFEWGKEYDIDGLVIDIDDKNIRKNLGRERNNNPSYSRAYKNVEWSTKNLTPYIGIEWNLSKTKALKPVVLVEPFNVEGVTISRVTGYNAKFINDNQIGLGSILEIIRSGGVIPKIIGVNKTGEVNLPVNCPSCDNKLIWNENGIDLICNNIDCGEINFQKLTFFFINFEIAGFAEKTIKRLYDLGYDTVGKILSMSFDDIQRIEGLGALSATKLLKEFDDKIKSASFEQLGHASGCFENLGSRKIKMIVDGIENFDKDKKYYIDELVKIKGVSIKTARFFIVGLMCFNEFMKDLDIEIIKEELIKKNNDMKNSDFEGREFVFTGFRDAELKDYIENLDGIVKDGITKKTTDLITKNVDSTSVKAKKALEIGATITQVDDFRDSIGL